MSHVIREATVADVVAVAELLAQLGYPSDESEVADRLKVWNDTAGTVLVAEFDGAVAGLVAVHLMPFLERTGMRARVVALVVHEKWRSRQVGHRLLTAAEDYARARDCEDMEITSSRSRQTAMSFYARHAYRDVSPEKARFLKSLRPLAWQQSKNPLWITAT